MRKFFGKLSIITLSILHFLNSEAVTVKKIEVNGNQRILTETILANINIHANEEYSVSKQEESLKNLYNTGLFEDIKIYFNENNGTLKINLLEKPLIYQVFFEGNKQIDSKKLGQEIRISGKETLRYNLIQQAVFRILDLYQQQGYYNAKIEPKLIKLSQNRINLVFEINEGKESCNQKTIFCW